MKVRKSTHWQLLYQLARGHWGSIAGLTLVATLHVPIALLFVWVIKHCVDIATGQIGGNLTLALLSLLPVVMFRIGVNALHVYISGMTAVRVGNDLRRRIYGHVLFVRWVELNKMHSGDLLTRLIKDTDDIINLLVKVFPLAVSSFLQLLAVLVWLWWVDARLAIILALVMPALLLLSAPYWIRMKRYSRQIKESESGITEVMEETFLHHLLIQTYGRQSAWMERLRSKQEKLYRHTRARSWASVWARVVINVAFTGGYLLAFFWGVLGIAAGSLSFGTLTALLQLVNYFQRPLLELMQLAPSIVSSQAALERLGQLLAFGQEQSSNLQPLPGVEELCLRNLSFRYEPTSREILHNFSLTLGKGEMVAIMGPTGAGKTTLIRLLLSLLSPNSGEIEIIYDGGKKASMSERLRGNFVYVPQGNSLFAGSIRSNLLMGAPEASEEEMLQALRLAEASFVEALPNGLDYAIGRSGSGLSEGQAQRIAIARALLRPGQIFLFDEATSALDEGTEDRLLHNLRAHMADSLILFITHHPSVAEHCDRIVHFQRGH